MKKRGKAMMAILVGKEMAGKSKKCKKCKGKCSCDKY